MRVLAVGCHPDDLEIACGGTLRKYVEQGAEVYTCHVANGNQGHVIIEPEPLTAMCAEEFEEASRIIGAKQTFNLNVGDMPVNSHDLAVMDAMADVVRCTRPDVIITHYDAVRKRGADRRHGDHTGAGGKLPREMELQKSVYVCGGTAERPGDRRGLYRVPGFPARAAGNGCGRRGQAHSE